MIAACAPIMKAFILRFVPGFFSSKGDSFPNSHERYHNSLNLNDFYKRKRLSLPDKHRLKSEDSIDINGLVV